MHKWHTIQGNLSFYHLHFSEELNTFAKSKNQIITVLNLCTVQSPDTDKTIKRTSNN